MKDEISAHTSILQIKMSSNQNFIIFKNKSISLKKYKNVKTKAGAS